MKPEKSCPACGKPLNYDSWEDCYLCINDECSGKKVYYPENFGESKNPEAGIWKL